MHDCNDGVLIPTETIQTSDAPSRHLVIDPSVTYLHGILPVGVLGEAHGAATGNPGSRRHLQDSHAAVTASIVHLLSTVRSKAVALLSGLHALCDAPEAITADSLLGFATGVGRLMTGLQHCVLVLASYIHACSSSNPLAETTGTHMNTTSLMAVEDIESTPQKKGMENITPVNTDGTGASFDYLQSVNNVLDALLSALQTDIAPQLRELPVPMLIPVKAFAECQQSLRGLQFASLLLVNSVASDSRLAQCQQRSHTLHAQVTELADDYAQRGAASFTQWLEDSALDSVVRQQWSSDSKYMRDRKITLALTSLGVTLRGAVWDLYAQVPVLHWGQQRLCYSEASKLALQILLTAAVQVTRVYTGTYDSVRDSEGDGTMDALHSNSAGAVASTSTAVTQRWVSPSRVRLAQWKRDVGYFVSIVWDTLAWILQNDVTRILGTSSADYSVDTGIAGLCERIAQHQYELGSELHNRPSMSVGEAQFQQLLVSPAYQDQAEITTEIVQVLRYLLLCLHLVTDINVDGLLTDLSGVEVTPRGSQSNEGNRVTEGSRGCWSSLVQLAQCVRSSQDWLAPYGLTVAEEGATGSFAAVSPAGWRRPVGHFDVTVDVVAGGGLHHFAVSPCNDAELQQYRTLLGVEPHSDGDDTGGAGDRAAQLKAAAGTLSAQAAVAFHRWSTLTVARPNYLLQLLSQDEASFMSVFAESNDSEAGGAVAKKAFIVDMLQRRYEMIRVTYPPLTAEETSAAISIAGLVDSLKQS